jgi:multidrug efflux pump subunit AcrA (membrane-fusion protein)
MHMCMRVLGRIKRAVLVSWVMAGLLGLSSPAVGYTANAPGSQPSPASSSWKQEIIFNGKLACSLKRRIDLPFKGVITSLRVHSGQPVNAGDILATYRLAPEAVLAIQKRLSPPEITDTEVKLAETERSLVPLVNKQRELNQLVQKKLAPPQSLADTNRNVDLLRQEKAALQASLQKDRQLAEQDRKVLSEQLETSLKSGRVPREVSLKSPIKGYVISINPAIRVGAELPPMPGAFQVGVMNPMVVRGEAFEIEALQIKVGEQAEVTLDALPGRKFQGKVSRISWSSTTAALDKPSYYNVEITVPNPDLALKDGLKARIVLHKSK